MGQLSRGYMHGRGVLKYVHGEAYEGSFANGYIFGYGKLTYTDGGFYDGEFKKVKHNKITDTEIPCPDGKRHGIGIRVWTSGSKYIGEWEADKMNGRGTLTNLQGSLFFCFILRFFLILSLFLILNLLSRSVLLWHFLVWNAPRSGY